ncbi:hypothetical protein [Nocardia brasiliensis]|uniref:DUF1772 domain-containing protein n=1 Tax=Nocardia brasiliensis (strain ATCC 700358 / HUJEG-1) TaxID=1133849 RepID=K0EYR6_NOCB7|nr:hypothetical protein [Nocardia brasiliensis]AFU02025.1 hypothetical protein O3I_020330 [Nocardia brasiliensis ATCC 700358]OCF87750.1 hypothetical protein AW168_25075 [Nocardia brasiliensis]
MFSTVAQVVAIVSVLANAVIYGTDACYALVTRAVYARMDDSTLTASAGWGHYYGDRRMPVFGAGGVITAVLTVVLAAIGGQFAAAVAAGIAVAALVIWLLVYVRVAKPVNTVQTAAAQAGTTPPNARALQDKWDSVIPARVALQTIALGGLTAAIALI